MNSREQSNNSLVAVHPMAQNAEEDKFIKGCLTISVADREAFLVELESAVNVSK